MYRPLHIRLRNWLIRRLAGRSPIILNTQIQGGTYIDTTRYHALVSGNMFTTLPTPPSRWARWRGAVTAWLGRVVGRSRR